jgi:hypothetical protein
MKKTYENIEITLILLFNDVVTGSQENDNVSDMIEFPETLIP